MTGKMANRQEAAKEVTLRLLDEWFGKAGAPPVAVRLWDGDAWRCPSAEATLVLKHPGALRALLLPGDEVGLAEAFLFDDCDIEGDCEAVFDLAERLAAETSGWRLKWHAAKELLRLPPDGAHPWAAAHGMTQRRGPAKLSGKRHSVERDRHAVTYHYDVSNDFFALWLDRRMVYSCAYFQRPDEDLDAAQENKLDYLCRKLRLRPGQRLLDIGCGWGGLVIHAAGRYGVKATGITLSEPQARLAEERIRAAGLENRCRVRVADYREMTEQGAFDALASVGMFEHVGEARLAAYFRRAYDLLKPGGVFLNHGIVRRAADAPRAGRNFVDAYVFPDGELIPIGVTLKTAEEAGFEIRDVESLREHYALTLRHWVRRLESAREAALQYVEEPTYRVWRLYMSGSAHGFAHGRLNVHQTLMIKPGPGGQSGLPLTRSEWYWK